MKDHLAAGRDDVEDQIALADRAAAREDDHVRGRTRIERARQRVERVLHRPVPIGHAAVGGDDGGEREAVDVEDLTGRQRVSGVDDLVASRQNRHARAFVHFHVRAPYGSQRPHAARREHVAGIDHERAGRDIGASWSDVLIGRRRREDLHRVAGSPFDISAPVRRRGRVLDHHHGVGALGDRGAGRDFRAEAAGDRAVRHLTGVDALGDAESYGRVARRARGVGRDHGVSVHRRSRERRHVDARRHAGGDHPAGGVGQRHALGSRDRPDRGRETAPGFLEGDGGGERTHVYRDASWTRCPSSGMSKRSIARRTAFSDPGSATTMRPATRPAQARLSMAAEPICS